VDVTQFCDSCGGPLDEGYYEDGIDVYCTECGEEAEDEFSEAGTNPPGWECMCKSVAISHCSFRPTL
jgi:uncharacterized Zn finger protein (UPF0148 family)